MFQIGKLFGNIGLERFNQSVFVFVFLIKDVFLANFNLRNDVAEVVVDM